MHVLNSNFISLNNRSYDSGILSIKELKAKGIGVLITDHNVRETLGICDYAYILKDGKIQVSGNAEEITNSELARKFYLGENFKL